MRGQVSDAIKARIKTVGNIRKITRAMQLVAAAKLTRAQERAHTVRPYAEELDGILGAISGAAGGDEAADTPMEMSFVDDAQPIRTTREKLFAQNEVKRPGIVLMTSDRGLCGAYNTNLIRRAQALLEEHSDKDVKLITLGKKGNAFFKRRKVDIIQHREGIDDKLNLAQIKEITGKLVELYVSGEVDAIYLVYARSIRASLYEVTVQKFLSITPVEEDAAADENYIIEPDTDSLFATLIPLYATTTIFSALADSFASEYGAKMAAMQLATKNAEDRISDLVILRNRMRQSTITKELAEIVGGAEALK